MLIRQIILIFLIPFLFFTHNSSHVSIGGDINSDLDNKIFLYARGINPTSMFCSSACFSHCASGHVIDNTLPSPRNTPPPPPGIDPTSMFCSSPCFSHCASGHVIDNTLPSPHNTSPPVSTLPPCSVVLLVSHTVHPGT